MEVGEQKLPFAQAFALNGLGLFDFDDHVSGPDAVQIGDVCTSGDVIRIRKASAQSGTGLDQDAVAMG